MAGRKLTGFEMILLSVVFGVWIVLGTVGTVMFSQDLLSYQGSEKWPTTTGRITLTQVRGSRSSKGTTSYYPEVTYSYQAEGRSYSSRQETVINRRMGSPSEAESYLNRNYAAGKPVTVYYKPRHPEIALLIPGVGFSDYAMTLLPGGFVIIGAIAWGLSYRRWRRTRLVS